MCVGICLTLIKYRDWAHSWSYYLDKTPNRDYKLANNKPVSMTFTFKILKCIHIFVLFQLWNEIDLCKNLHASLKSQSFFFNNFFISIASLKFCYFWERVLSYIFQCYLTTTIWFFLRFISRKKWVSASLNCVPNIFHLIDVLQLVKRDMCLYTGLGRTFKKWSY